MSFKRILLKKLDDIQQTSVRVENALNKNCRTFNPSMAIAGINATVITILIAIISAYSLFVFGIMQEMEMQVLKEAERINKIQFIRSSYLPNDNKYSISNDPNDIDFSFNIILNDLNLLYSSFCLDRNSKLKNGEGIPKNSSKRAEKALQLLNVLCNSYPFPKTIIYHKKGWFHSTPKPLVFNDISIVRSWLSDLKEVIDCLEPSFLLYPEGLPESLSDDLNSLIVQKESEIRKRSTVPPLIKIQGYIDPSIIFDDLNKNILQADNIASSVEYQLKKVNMFKQELPSKALMVLGLVFSFVVLLSGVIVPLIWNNVPRFFRLWFPAFFYAVSYGYIVFFILQKIWKI